MPISKICRMRDVPPDEKKGREIPVLGTELVTTAMFRMVCRATLVIKPYTTMEENLSGALAAMLDLGEGSGPMNHAFDLQGEYAKEVR